MSHPPGSSILWCTTSGATFDVAGLWFRWARESPTDPDAPRITGSPGSLRLRFILRLFTPPSAVELTEASHDRFSSQTPWLLSPRTPSTCLPSTLTLNHVIPHDRGRPDDNEAGTATSTTEFIRPSASNPSSLMLVRVLPSKPFRGCFLNESSE